MTRAMELNKIYRIIKTVIITFQINVGKLVLLLKDVEITDFSSGKKLKLWIMI